jgi:hypothetical protein
VGPGHFGLGLSVQQVPGRLWQVTAAAIFVDDHHNSLIVVEKKKKL